MEENERAAPQLVCSETSKLRTTLSNLLHTT